MTIDEYIGAQPVDIQPILLSVRQTIATVIPDAEERISYGMPTFWKRHNLIHFTGMKNHLGIYPGDLTHCRALEHLFVGRIVLNEITGKRNLPADGGQR